MTVVKIKKQKAQKSVTKRKLKFQGYKNCLEATQFENKINHLEKNKIDGDSPKEFIKKKKKNTVKNTKKI